MEGTRPAVGSAPRSLVVSGPHTWVGACGSSTVQGRTGSGGHRRIPVPGSGPQAAACWPRSGRVPPPECTGRRLQVRPAGQRTAWTRESQPRALGAPAR